MQKLAYENYPMTMSKDFAQVYQSVNGRAKTLLQPCVSSQPIPVFAHVTHLPTLKVGDWVCVEHKDVGVIITHRLEEFNVDVSLEINLQKDLIIHANNVLLSAKQKIKLLAKRIDLN